MQIIIQHLTTLVTGLLIGLIAAPLLQSSRIQLVSHSHTSQLQPRDRQTPIFPPGMDTDPATGAFRCGETWQEASDLGCKYDIMSTRWYYGDCFNDEVLQTMLEEVPFEFYEDANHTKQIPTDFALSGKWDDVIWPYPNTFHMIHCLYIWRRLHANIIEHRPIDDKIFDYGHTLHCTRMLMQWPEKAAYGMNSSVHIFSGTEFCRDRGF